MLTKRVSCSRSSLTDDESDRDENSHKIKKVSSTRKKSYKKWTKDEDERLKNFINSNGGIKDWSQISKFVGNSRTDAQCQHRWERFLDPSITKGPWTDEEDKKVIELVRDYGARQWSLIAKELKGRVGKQCRERWHNHLNPAINKNPWTNEENIRLFILHQHFGNKWAEIAKYFNGRSDNSIKNHWNSSMKKKFELEVSNLKRQGLEWTALIPPDFPWPKIDKSSSRQPLNSITNRKISNQENKCLSPIELPITNSENSNQFYLTQQISTNFSDPLQSINSETQTERSSQDLERLFYCTPPSPIKQLPMLSSCADYTSSSQNSQTNLFQSSVDFYSTNSPTRSTSLQIFHLSPNLFSNDDSFSINFHSQKENEHLLIDLTHHEQNQQIVISPKTISNTSSPSKHRVLNTPERLDQPHRIHLTEHDWFNDFLSNSEPMTTENCSSIRSTIVRRNKRLIETKKCESFSRNLFNASKKIKEELGYNPSYTEILIGQTRDQRFVTEQARRYLSCSSLEN